MEHISDSFDIYKFMNEKNILFSFTGHFDHVVTTSLLENFKRRFSLFETNIQFTKKLYSLLVESVENMSKHAFHGPEKQNISILLLCKSDTYYTIITGNHILNDEIPALKEKLERVTTNSTIQLKEFYRKQLLSKFTKENNGGLGLMDIAIKTGGKLKFDFKPITPLTSIFILQIQTDIQ